MAKPPRLFQVLAAAESWLVSFDNYFRHPRWRENTGFSKRTFERFSSQSVPTDYRQLFHLLGQPWDGFWRVVAYDVPEASRRQRYFLRSQLHFWGFKPLQRSLWLSPLPWEESVRKLFRQLGQPRVYFFTARLEEVSSRRLAGDLWQPRSWQGEARQLLSRWQKSDRMDKKDKREFWRLIVDHPRLPRELLPKNWPLEKLVATFVSRVKRGG